MGQGRDRDRVKSFHAWEEPRPGCSGALVDGVCLCSAEDLNWNALEWERAAEELTWERVGTSFVCSVWMSCTLLLMSLRPFRMCVTLLFVSVPDVGSGWLLGVLGKFRLLWRSRHEAGGWTAGSRTAPGMFFLSETCWFETDGSVRLLGARVLGGVHEHALHPGLW